MWRNHGVLELLEWLRAYNAEMSGPEHYTGFHGLDLYSLFTSVDAVIKYLNAVIL